ncbi:hypothetical protein A5761_11155 [Mycolicibacterium setense]|uniref:FtsK/SpoIIIE domain-containing protein n=1 Tax=Mycolicibacterium setense TaxID=431269 RepID=UPI0007EA94ED|nr:FtsK/SpoIIIE domain-containing protein [Mycolicibacterium setense]OBB17009.1 hypothetical protein A5761_11155 [Mycolicibacterium setense]
MKFDEKDLVTATELARNAAYLLANVGNGRRFVIVNRNSPTAALISMDDLRLLESLTENGHVPTGFEPGSTSTADPVQAYLDAIGVTDLATFDAREAWANSAESALQIPLGLAPNGIPATIDFTPVHDGGDGGHGLIQGTTGAGKSTALASMVLSLCARYSPDRVNFVLVSRFHTTFRGFEALPHVQRVFDGRDASAVDDLVDHLNASVAERVKLITDSELPAFDLESSSASAPLLFVVIDDVEPMLNGAPGVKLHDFLDNISREGRALQINLLLATQRTLSLPAGFTRMVSYRVALTTLDAVDSRAIIGTDEAKFLPIGNGAAIVAKQTSRPSLPRFEFFNVQAAGADGVPIRQALIARIAETASNEN